MRAEQGKRVSGVNRAGRVSGVASGAKQGKRRRRVIPKPGEQLGMLNAAGTKLKSKRGGARPGAGRPPKGARVGSPHKRRAAFAASQPLHVVLRVEQDVVSAVRGLRRRAIYAALRVATLVVARPEYCEGFRIVHLSIQRTHVHLLVEARNKSALASGMQAFQISAAKRINAAVGRVRGARRRGRVFTDRYHAEIISSPRQARHTLAYVLNNWRKHREDRDEKARRWLVDPFSSGWSFPGWKQLEGRLMMWSVPETYQPLFVWLPRTWLLSTGWRRHGLIDASEVPRTAKPRKSQVRTTS